MGEPYRRIDTSTGEAFVVPVLVKGGLMVHVAHPGALLAPNEKLWRVTHIASGYLVAKGAGTSEQACLCLEDLLPVTDWTVDLKGILDVVDDVRAAVKKVIRGHRMSVAGAKR